MLFGASQFGTVPFASLISDLGPNTYYLSDTVTHVETVLPTLTVPVLDTVIHVETFKVAPEFHESVAHTERLIASLNGNPWDLIWIKIAKTAADVWTKIAKP